ncbi:hypothetical protein SUDANB108_06845 [Streptomyces sp. enrichment culture]|uniref:ANTAR domain-containing protein n=1 Tax=Streptomyces sp. enrichment culture TaxID=1795815 RepID=UPI003F5649FF
MRPAPGGTPTRCARQRPAACPDPLTLTVRVRGRRRTTSHNGKDAPGLLPQEGVNWRAPRSQNRTRERSRVVVATRAPPPPGARAGARPVPPPQVNRRQGTPRGRAARATGGQALGVLLAVYRFTPTIGFEALREVSQRTNTKLRVTTRNVIDWALGAPLPKWWAGNWTRPWNARGARPRSTASSSRQAAGPSPCSPSRECGLDGAVLHTTFPGPYVVVAGVSVSRWEDNETGRHPRVLVFRGKPGVAPLPGSRLPPSSRHPPGWVSRRWAHHPRERGRAPA